jgi:hypothetical protein
MNTARSSDTASVPLNGNLLVIGEYNGSNRLNSAELYNISSGVWTTTGNIKIA